MKIFLGNGKYMEGELSSVTQYIDNEPQKIEGYVINGNFYDNDSFRKKFTRYMNINEAWRKLEEGKKIKLENWNNKYLYMTDDLESVVLVDGEMCYLNHKLSHDEYLSEKWILA